MNNERKEIYINDSIGNKIEEGYCANYKGKKCQYIPTQRYLYDENNRFIKALFPILRVQAITTINMIIMD